MKKQIKPAVAIAVIAVVVLVLGTFFYQKAAAPKPTLKVSEAAKLPGFKEAMQKKWAEGKGSEQGQ